MRGRQSSTCAPSQPRTRTQQRYYSHNKIFNPPSLSSSGKCPSIDFRSVPTGGLEGGWYVKVPAVLDQLATPKSKTRNQANFLPLLAILLEHAVIMEFSSHISVS